MSEFRNRRIRQSEQCASVPGMQKIKIRQLASADHFWPDL